MRVDENIYEQLDLSELLTECWSSRCVRQRCGKFIKAKKKSFRQLDPICARSLRRVENCPPQSRLKFVRREWCLRCDSFLQVLFRFLQFGAVILERGLGLAKIVFVRKWIEMLEAAALSGGGVEFRHRVAKHAFGVKEKPQSDKLRSRKRDQEISQPAIFLIPIHGNFSGFLRSRRSS